MSSWLSSIEIKFRMNSIASRLVLTGFLCLCLPLIGVLMTGHDLAPFLKFPPEVRDIGEIDFSWNVAIVYWAGMIALFAWLLKPRVLLVAERNAGNSTGSSFPLWGWLALAWLGFFWWLAWGRAPWFAWGQKFTFTPLWTGYILVMNALVHQRTGRCPMLERPGFFLILFPVSAIFWWTFEYYNRFVQNWIYLGSDVGVLEYFIHATVCFSTVLPAVYSTAVLLKTFPGLQARMRGPRLKFKSPVTFARAILLLCVVAFLLVGVRPRELYPLLWTGPLLTWMALSFLAGEPEDLGELRDGDWRQVWTWALAALVCGLFWEMWNSLSLVKWIYQVPHLHGVLVFEMPLAGFAGYLPFGLECAVVTAMIRRWALNSDSLTH
jgi:hypothetical protein